MSEDKQRISASIESVLKDQLDNKEKINKSQLVEELLREYLAAGESTAVALEIRRDELQRKRRNKRLQKDAIEDEIQSIDEKIADLTEKIKNRRDGPTKGVEEVVEQVGHGDGKINPEYLDDTNPIIKKKASIAGVDPDDFVAEVKAKLDASPGGAPADD